MDQVRSYNQGCDHRRFHHKKVATKIADEDFLIDSNPEPDHVSAFREKRRSDQRSDKNKVNVFFFFFFR